jgi:PAS domain S-box-containing protein
MARTPVTQRKGSPPAPQQTHQALRDSEAHLAAIFDHAAVGLTEVSLEGTLLRVNDEVCRILDRQRERLVGASIADITHPDDLPRCLAAFGRVIEAGIAVSLDKRYLRADGTPVLARSTLSRLDAPDGQPRSVLAVTVDLSEQRRTEEELRYRSEQFETLLNQAPLGVYLVDADFRLAQINPRARPVFAGIDEPIGRDFEEVLRILWGADFAKDVSAVFRRTLETGEPHVTPELSRVRADRQVLEHYEWRIDRITLPDGRHGAVCYFRDISDEVRTRRATAESEARYRTLFESMDQGFCVLEMLFDESDRPVDYRFLEVNPAFAEQTGLENALGRTATELVPDLEHTWIEVYGDVAVTGESVRFTNESPAMNRWFDAYAFRIGEPRERKVALLFNDITERVRAEMAIATMTAEIDRQRRLYDTIISSTPDLVYVFDRDYRFTFVNKALLEMWGRDLESSLGRTLAEVGYEPWHVEMHEREIDQVIATRQPVRGVVSFPHATLGLRSYDYIFVPVMNDAGEVECIVGTTRDVTDRQNEELHRERLLREVQVERKQLAELFEHAPSFMCELRGPDHVVVRANANYLRMVGGRDIIGKPMRDVVFETERRAFLRHLDHVFETGEPFRGSDVRLRFEHPSGPDGAAERWLDFVYQPIRDADGSIAGVLVQGVDLTERKRAEEALREADRRKDEFLATLAHELRNPLAAIRMAVSVLERARADTLRLDSMAAIIDRQSGQLVRLIDDLLDVSRITRGMVELRKSRVDLLLAIEHAVEGVRQTCADRNLRLTVSLPPHGIAIDADPLRFAQVIGNLVSNAARFTAEGGEIRIAARADGGDAVISVRDTGIGIAPEDLPRIFEMFVQLGDRNRRAGSGLGIGLALANSLVRLHGGTLSAESDGPGHGAEFTVRVPMLADEAPDAPSQAHETHSFDRRLRRRRHILAVDDNEDALDAIAEALRVDGHYVETATSGQDALQKAAAGGAEAVLLDIGMPGMDGYETARRMRGEPWGRGLLIIAMTGWGQEKDRQAAFEAGFDAHLTKPATADAIARLLEHKLPN